MLETIKSSRWKTTTEYYHSPSRTLNPLRLSRVDVMQRAFKFGSGLLWSAETTEFDKNRKSTGGEDDVHLINQQYEAELTRKKGSTGWLLGKVKRDPQAAAKRLDREDRCPWMEIANMPLNQWIREDAFVFTRIEILPSRNGINLSRAYFTYDQSRSPTHPLPGNFRSGYIDFDPTHSYRPTAYRFNQKNKYVEASMNGRIEYEDGDGVPVPRVMTCEEVGEVTGLRGERALACGKEVQTFSNVEYNGELRDEEFRLSHYDIPEPTGVVWPSGSRWWLWFIVMGVASLGLGAYFRRRVQRRKLAGAVAPATSPKRSES